MVEKERMEETKRDRRHTKMRANNGEKTAKEREKRERQRDRRVTKERPKTNKESKRETH